jgi:hypothetical protein
MNSSGNLQPLSEAGKKGAKRKAELKEQTTLKPPLNDPEAIKEDEEKEKEPDKKKKLSIEDRKKVFTEKVFQIGTNANFDKEMLNEFVSYWSEHGEEDRKMRFEKQTSFSITRRLGTWKRNKQKFDGNGSQNNTKNNRATTTTSERQSFE